MCSVCAIHDLCSSQGQQRPAEGETRAGRREVFDYLPVVVVVVVVAGSDTPGRQSEERRVSVSADRVHWPSTRRGNEIEGALHRGW